MSFTTQPSVEVTTSTVDSLVVQTHLLFSGSDGMFTFATKDPPLLSFRQQVDGLRSPPSHVQQIRHTFNICLYTKCSDIQ